VCPYVKIGDDAVVGAGSVVVADIPGGTTVCGVPARVTSRKSRELTAYPE
jgi:acetyltransferase-like isoleucine patch superfamily enzyme